MAIWDKVKQGIDKAGKAAQDVFDEGKLRLDAYRAREQADKAAEALGYAVFRAADAGGELVEGRRSPGQRVAHGAHVAGGPVRLAAEVDLAELRNAVAVAGAEPFAPLMKSATSLLRALSISGWTYIMWPAS